ncbi:hypothetical protein [Metallosphaera sedula]|uniref:hypothetical protein n=1 Tax=Metallosphaera sedula TaxID=43687 RepID=UPI000A4B2859|nr:hypothetical protein [Metallosphaera sedula]BBL47201.1 hypothetical protein MJ1HA_1302 [Metallosphaera sedula]
MGDRRDLYTFVYVSGLGETSNNKFMNWLILEEPDLNLHSDGQIKAEEKMVLFSKRLLITTHLGFQW